ncbi:hypothetical protein BDZ89DRAFT_1144957 [Hymenopellis radicata]|nr:hypothetical protein BDZ89DRAFT_1144957 [Hymenopellis radicata]
MAHTFPYGHPLFESPAARINRPNPRICSLITSPSTLFFGAVLFAGIIHLGLVPMLWPPGLPRAAEAQIKSTETLLHDECARRRNTAMANIYARGLARLDVFQAKVDCLSHRHRTLFHICRVHRYLRIAYKLSRNSQQCLRDVKDLRVDLELEIRALDHACFLAHDEVNAGPPTLPDLSLPVTNSVDTV